MKTIQKMLLFLFGAISLLIGVASPIGLIAAWATHSLGTVDYHFYISLLFIPLFIYVGWKWIRQASQISQ